MPTEEVLYLYEIQIDEHSRRCGLGLHLMTMIEHIASRANMQCIKLTVFKSNKNAMDFYLKKMKYCIDASSPSKLKTKNKIEYEILSKRISN